MVMIDSDYYDDIERSVSDLEILQAAYPDEVDILCDTDAINLDNSPDDLIPLFPLRFQLNLPTEIDSTRQPNSSPKCFIIMEIPLGYPTKDKIRIQSYRLSSTSIPNSCIEKTVSAVREMSQECFENKEEAALTICQIATTTWEETMGSFAADSVGSQEIDLTDNNTSYDNAKNVERKSIKWITGSILTDRKSKFQAHICEIKNESMVRLALEELSDSNNKIQRATHNMYAYRLKEKVQSASSDKKEQEILKHDNDDDGEDGAGSRLAQLLEMRNEDGVLIVVSRWYGGIHLGPKRFAHIVNVARELLVHFHETKQKNE